jgi:hypothetical protein
MLELVQGAAQDLAGIRSSLAGGQRTVSAHTLDGFQPQKVCLTVHLSCSTITGVIAVVSRGEMGYVVCDPGAGHC